jgi:hypothetical protein
LAVGEQPSASAFTSKLDVRSSGPAVCQTCHASITAAVKEQGHVMLKAVAAGMRTVLNESDVTTPKFPQPAPRSAQNSSWS